MGLSLRERVARLSPSQRESFLRSMGPERIAEIARGEWWWTARPEQIPPDDGDWFIRLVLTGRGWGKTRSGAEWIVERSIKHPYDTSGAPTERLVVGHTIADVRTTLIGGPSGILRVLERRGVRYRHYKSPKPMIVFMATGAIIHGVGAENEDVGRGFNLADAWLDEVIKWPKPGESWTEGIMPAIRTSIPGNHPRVYVTTTPKPIPLLREWVKTTDGSVATISGSTYDNAANLSPQVLAKLREKYEGTRIGQQELHGRILDDLPGVIFDATAIEASRVEKPPKLERIVVGVDPALTGKDDETGIVVVGVDSDGDWYVLADESIQGVGREAAAHCWRVFAAHGAEKLVVETNLGRRWMTETFEDAYRSVAEEVNDQGRMPAGVRPPIESIDAKTGKETRARPVGQRCEQGRLHFVGRFQILETQACDYDPVTSKDSPDRMDALVHACLYLKRVESRVVTISRPPARPLFASRPDFPNRGGYGMGISTYQPVG